MPFISKTRLHALEDGINDHVAELETYNAELKRGEASLRSKNVLLERAICDLQEDWQRRMNSEQSYRNSVVRDSKVQAFRDRVISYVLAAVLFVVAVWLLPFGITRNLLAALIAIPISIAIAGVTIYVVFAIVETATDFVKRSIR